MEANLTHTSCSDDQSEQDYYYINMEVVDNYNSNEEFEFEFQTSSVSTFSFPNFHDDGSPSTFATPIFTPTATSANNTPFGSCNISPSESPHHVSYRDVTMTSSGGEEKKHPSWAKMIKPATSNKWTTYLKSLFTKKQCSNSGHFKTSGDNKDRRKKQSFSKTKTTSSSSEILRTEIENPIQAAIAHCKRSHKQMYSKQIAAI